jgi:6-phosphogluconolactonase
MSMKYGALLAALLCVANAFAADIVYVSVAGENRIALFKIDDANGTLSPAGSTATSAEPGALTTDSNKRFLFAALRSSGELAAFRIDPVNGKLTHINTVPAGADPAQISTDKEGKFLLTAYYVAGQVTVHDIGSDGSLSKKPRQTIKTKEKAHSIVLSPSGWAALVPHTGPNVIYTFKWYQTLGKLLEDSQYEYKTPNNTGPRHVVFHPTLIKRGIDSEWETAYVANEQGGSVTMYKVEIAALFGKIILSPKETISTLPADFRGTNACAEIRLHPSNRFLYVSNRGHDSIAAFQVDKETGRLTSLGQTPTEKTPRSFDVSPSGKFLYAAGESSGRLAAYRIDETSGKLQRSATYEVGAKPWWVMTVRLTEK